MTLRKRPSLKENGSNTSVVDQMEEIVRPPYLDRVPLQGMNHKSSDPKRWGVVLCYQRREFFTVSRL